MAKSAVTIIDIARELGMSKTTVSNALMGAGRVSEATRQKTLMTAERMGYVSNRAARLLRRSQTGALGLYIPGHVRNLSFYMDFAFGAADESALHDLDLTLIGRAVGTAGRAAPPRVDGLLAIDGLAGDPVLDSLLASDFPVVTVGRMLDAPTDRSLAVIEIDHYDMASALLESIRAAGARRPVLLASDEKFSSSYTVDVTRAYVDWCSGSGIEPVQFALSVTPTDQQLAAAVRDIVGRGGVDGLISVAQGVAGRAASVLQSMGLSLAESFHLGSFSGDPTTELGNPLIHAVDLRPREFGHESVKFLCDVMSGQASDTSRRSHRAELTAG
ncbi:LacI family DNA-binding transcriptional regulator [Rhodococcus fascians]|nr:LacI family DNA-binding transcriptional regulator [Rhodococcus fascians]MBY4140893.1 LacI family DNA-binding transcriptional regulator [Rhodococcus fascians]MBY4219557.1 LacI family DNA-binding transcriptional regulator [Rhodococcus fascians]MBY4221866.1 LacI family DNA-binding transcriptional regulator [Rhodococcus fascians]MBY4233867.1 LacI family DNA-binding transcriptional regulator [Rhodococcus fascians]